MGSLEREGYVVVRFPAAPLRKGRILSALRWLKLHVVAALRTARCVVETGAHVATRDDRGEHDASAFSPPQLPLLSRHQLVLRYLQPASIHNENVLTTDRRRNDESSQGCLGVNEWRAKGSTG